MCSPVIEPGPHWWETNACMTTAPSLKYSPLCGVGLLYDPGGVCMCKFIENGYRYNFHIVNLNLAEHFHLFILASQFLT